MNKGFLYQARHRKDDLKNRGFNYYGKIFQRSLSSAMFLENKRAGIIQKFNNFISELVDTIKYIKKSYNWTFDKNDASIN
jgi:hypothetical protein